MQSVGLTEKFRLNQKDYCFCWKLKHAEFQDDRVLEAELVPVGIGYFSPERFSTGSINRFLMFIMNSPTLFPEVLPPNKEVELYLLCNYKPNGDYIGLFSTLIIKKKKGGSYFAYPARDERRVCNFFHKKYNYRAIMRRYPKDDFCLN